MRVKKLFHRYVAWMSRPTPGWPALQKIRFVMNALMLSNLGLVIVNFTPRPFAGKDNPWNGSFAYWMLALIYVGFMALFKVPSLSFMRLPILDWKSGLAIVLAVAIGAQRVNLGLLAHKSVWTLFVGAVSLFSIGLGEEIVSRGFAYGIFTRFGQNFAIVLSSVLFGLLHLGWYMGKYWDPWMAYWHVTNAAAFGFFLCCLMIACRSIWPAVLLHGVWDWSIGFDYANVPFPKAGHVTHSAFVAGIADPLWQVVPAVFFGMVLVYLRRGELPKWLEKVAVRFKLVEV
jgi:membrane protease YdiL (CAAX protease family)